MQPDNTAIEQLRNDVGSELLPMILSRFICELEAKHQALPELIAAGELIPLADCAHSLRSTARTVGLISIAELAAELENAARDGDAATALAAGNQLSPLCEAGIVTIREALANETE